MRRKLGRRPVQLGRREGTRDPRPRVLVVCEGECTEPYYFEGLRRDLGLGNVQVMGRECGSSPINVVDHALRCYENDKSIDKIFCVFDRDEHHTFDDACNKILDAKRRGLPIDVIRSYPSFEFWYILHFKFTRSPLIRSGKRSPGDSALKALRLEFPNYNKSMRDIWNILCERAPLAINNAKKASIQAGQDGEENPSTEVYKIVTYLFTLSEGN